MIACVASFRPSAGARHRANCARRSKRARNPRWFVAILFCGFSGAGMADTGLLNDTGVVTFATTTSTTLTTEPFDYPGQDARIGRDAQAMAGQLTKVGSGPKGFDFTKIANNGSELPATAELGSGPNDWACTRDNITGLVWEVKTTSGLRSGSHTYTYYNSNTSTNGGYAGPASGGTCETPGRCDTEKYTQDVNAAGLCGRSDWRMPTFNELVSVADFGSDATWVTTNPGVGTTSFAETRGLLTGPSSPNILAGNVDAEQPATYMWVALWEGSGIYLAFRDSTGSVIAVSGSQ